jgi:hypothetical protein
MRGGELLLEMAEPADQTPIALQGLSYAASP